MLFGQSKVAPSQTTSIPRLEMCATVLASQAVHKIEEEIDVEIDEITFYMDLKVVLCYIQNESRRFYLYLAKREQTIRKMSNPSQWKIVSAVLCARNTHLIQRPRAKELQGESFSEELKAERWAPESNKPQTGPKSSKL